LTLTLVLVAMPVMIRAMALNRCWFQIDGEQIDVSQNTWRAIQSNIVCASELVIF
jgi:hypothetical protein